VGRRMAAHENLKPGYDLPVRCAGRPLAERSSMLNRLTFALLLAAGCTDHATGSSNEPVLTGNTCQVHTDATACDQDADCTWLATGCACPENTPSCTCPAGACVSKSGSGS